MIISSIETFPLRLRRDLSAAAGTAGSPTALRTAASDYRWAEHYPCLYSVNFETALVKITLDNGLAGWGEAQAPLAPEVACTIIRVLLAPVLAGQPFDGAPREIEALWDRLYSTMRVRGQTGGFMIDAISALDVALWDLAGKLAGLPVSRLPAYISGLPLGGDWLDAARDYVGRGFRRFKLFYDAETTLPLLHRFDVLQSLPGPGLEVAVDALWRFSLEEALAFGRELDQRGALWFEAPLAPEDPVTHAALAHAIRTPVAIGESYRTRYEIAPFLRERAAGVLQPDLGRCGLTEGARMAAAAQTAGWPVVPHVSIAFGPQLAAALHFAAATPNCSLVEYNPKVLEAANRFLHPAIAVEGDSYLAPQGPGLGIDLDEEKVRALAAVA